VNDVNVDFNDIGKTSVKILASTIFSVSILCRKKSPPRGEVSLEEDPPRYT
jgi:hypothetical protein